MPRLSIVILTLIMGIAPNLKVFATEGFEKIMEFGAWDLYRQSTPKDPKCFVVATPYRNRAFEGIRSLPFALFEYKGQDEFTFSINLGFVLHAKNHPTLMIADYSTALQSSKDSYAYTYSAAQDKEIINQLNKNMDFFNVKGYNSAGEVSVDYYSTKGLTDALLYMNEECSQ
jgi:hypothetical protein